MRKRIFSLFIIFCMICATFLNVPAIRVQASSYSSDYRYWSQGASDDAGLKKYGCWVVAQAKMIYELNIDRSASFNPDTYLKWQKNNGYINDGYYQIDGANAPVAYANSVGKSLTYLGYWDASDSQLWFNINAGYYTILRVNGGGHYVLIANELSKSTGQLYCYDSWSSNASVQPQLISRYSVHDGGYVYLPSSDGGVADGTRVINTGVTSITDTSARINAKVSPSGTTTEMGFYLGTSPDNMQKTVENASQPGCQIIWYDLGTGKWCGALQRGTTYYYQIYAVIGGVTYKSSVDSFTTTGDSQPPTISNVQVTNVTRDGYTVTCNVEDNAGGVGVERVSFPTWSDVNGQDDLSGDWYNVCAVYPSGTGNTYTFNVNVANHGYAEGGYTTHIYAYDKCGNYSSSGVTAYINRQIPLQSFTLSTNNINLNINQTQQLSVTSYTPSDTTVDKTATWQSSDRTVATVDSQGNVKALKAGTATITCTVAGKTKTCTVKVAKAVTESPAKITKQPSSQKVNEGKTATFTVKTSGSGLTYQWQVSKNNGKKWSNTSMSGNNTSTLKVKASKGRNGYRFRCIVKDKKGNTITSKAVKLTVTSNVKITKQPSSQKVKEGKTATFTVKASGTKLKYQWQVSKDNGKKWSNTSLSGNKTSKLKVKASKGRNGYKFRCIIKDKNGKKVTSKAVKLTVTTSAKTTKYTSDLEVNNTTTTNENIEIIEEIIENSVSSNDISVSGGDSLEEE